MIRSARLLLKACRVLNGFAAAFMIAATAALLIDPIIVARGLEGIYGANVAVIRWLLIGLCLIIVATCIAADRIFAALITMIDTVAGGSPFIVANADRLRTIAWSLLIIQLLDLGTGSIAITMSRLTGDHFGWSFGAGGWIAVLLLFVLTGVFRQGAEMQADLDGTV